jgi:hypothetical protein
VGLAIETRPSRPAWLEALSAFDALAPDVFNPWRQSDPLDVSPTGHFARPDRLALHFNWVRP